MIPPLPPGMEMIGWIIWIFFIFLIGAGILLILKSIFPNVLQQTVARENIGQNTLDETMRDLLQEIKMLRREIEELRKELKE